ncbi:response regulator transcription factor [Actinocrispum wychmicini]|uniref:Regulatory LuxR family protein n=1 Tax=Actinocrispum wychmicini TaxID=1213861 RepID=A0A4R2JJC6_9PSEU|nr:helix-turn-helix transcriptional regulator [Actinocrispum wychmicini]TCO57108.1 regulatory LuxR family protein [Actinocrispum wychmicini]
MADEPTPSTLGLRGQQVLVGMSYGLTNAEIAGLLGLSPHTVHTHISRLMRTLQCHERAHAVRLGFERGFLTMGDPLPRARRQT